MKILHEITLDVSRAGVQATIPLTALDGGVHRILVHLRNGATPLTFEANDTAAFFLDRDMLDPVTVYTSEGVYPNTLCYDVSQYASLEDGLFEGTFIVNKKAESIAYSPKIALAIQKNITGNSAMLESPQYGAILLAVATAEGFASDSESSAIQSKLSAMEALSSANEAKERAQESASYTKEWADINEALERIREIQETLIAGGTK